MNEMKGKLKFSYNIKNFLVIFFLSEGKLALGILGRGKSFMLERRQTFLNIKLGLHKNVHYF